MTADVLIVAAGYPGQCMWTALRSKDFRRMDAHVVGVDDEVTEASFDATSDTWTLHVADGGTHSGQVVIAAGPSRPPDGQLTPYLGVANHGMPNYFLLAGSSDVTERARYIAECVRLMLTEGCTRIEVRRSSQRLFNDRPTHVTGSRDWARMRKHIKSAFEIWSPERDSFADVYDGPAMVLAAGAELAMRARLTGHLDPIDGRYHWQGMLFGDMPVAALTQRDITVTVDGRSTQARIGELTPWGHHSVTGVGAPPFAI